MKKNKKGCVKMSNKNSFLKVELLQQYDVINQVYLEDMSIKVDINAIHCGIIKDIGATEFAVLMAIASYTDNHGQAFPSQRLLADLTGLSLPTINKIVNKLLKTEINGVPVLLREFEQSGKSKRFSVYSLNTSKSENEKSDLKVNFQNDEAGEEPVAKPKTAKDFGHMFKHLYEQEYGIPYQLNYARELSMIKTKLMKNFTDEQIVEIIEFTIKNYKGSWSKDAYPYPTISMLCSWLANTVMQVLTKQKEKEAEQQRLQEMTADYIEADYSSFDDI